MSTISVLLAVGLIAQLVLPVLSAQKPPAEVTSQKGYALSVSSISPDALAAQLEQAVTNLLQAKDPVASRLALDDVKRVWKDLVNALNTARRELLALEADLESRGFEISRAQLLVRIEDLDHHFTQLKATYDEILRQSIRDDQKALREAAENLAAVLRANTVNALRLPQSDSLPVSPVSEPSSIVHQPAIGRVSLTAAHVSSQNRMESIAQWATVTASVGPTEDAPLTAEIVSLAAQLGYDPVAIYEYVRNTIAFEPYYGSYKGALLTLWERRGNDVDIASLLIALLRASGYPARYAYSTVAIDGESARNWVGHAPDIDTAAAILASGRVPVSVTQDGYLIKEHFWVEMDISAHPWRIYIPLIRKASTHPATILHREETVAYDTAATLDAVANSEWIALDASFKQFTYHAPADLSATTGFSTSQWIDEVRGGMVYSDAVRTIYGLPRLPSQDEPDSNDYDLEFADVKVQQAVSRTLEYLEANPQLTNAELLGGSYIITETISAFPHTLPFAIVPGESVTTFTELPETFRNTVAFEVYRSSGALDVSYRASFPSLAGKRLTLSYEAASPYDQSVIDSYGGTLLKTPPIVNLVPVLRVNGTEVARGTSAGMGTLQTRSLTITAPNAYTRTLQNQVRVGEMVAVGLGYGHTSTAAVEASQQRLAEARAALPLDADGDPDINAPGNMAEPVIGESLNLAMLAYFDQLDAYSELVARGRDVRWFRYLSAGVAIQNMAFSYFFGAPLATLGGGMSYDIQRNVMGVISLQNNPDDKLMFLRTVGIFGSALEHSLFDQIGRGAVSTIRLLEMAQANGTAIHRIDSTNKNQIFPLLQLSSNIESYISNSVDRGRIITVSERGLVVGDWVGVGFIEIDPATGAFGYWISGGLGGNVDIVSGGAIWSTLKEVAAYAWLGINMGLDLWGLLTGIGLWLLPEPTLLTDLAGFALIAANLFALGLDVSDLTDLTRGDKAASQYIGEQLSGLIIGAILKRVGIAAAAKIVERMGPDAVSKVARQLGKLTDGASDRLVNRGFSESDLIKFSERLTTPQAWNAVDDLAAARGTNVARTLMNNDYFAGKGSDVVEQVARAVKDAPNATGVLDTIEQAVKRGDFGYAYELRRAIASQDAGQSIVEYGRRVNVNFQEVVDVDAGGNPIFGGPVTRLLEGDIVLSDGTWIDAKHGPQTHIGDLRIWNQIVKAQAAINQGLIPDFRFEVSGSMHNKWVEWAAQNAPGVEFISNLGDSFR